MAVLLTSGFRSILGFLGHDQQLKDGVLPPLIPTPSTVRCVTPGQGSLVFFQSKCIVCPSALLSPSFHTCLTADGLLQMTLVQQCRLAFVHLCDWSYFKKSLWIDAIFRSATFCTCDCFQDMVHPPFPFMIFEWQQSLLIGTSWKGLLTWHCKIEGSAQMNSKGPWLVCWRHWYKGHQSCPLAVEVSLSKVLNLKIALKGHLQHGVWMTGQTWWTCGCYCMNGSYLE